MAITVKIRAAKKPRSIGRGLQTNEVLRRTRENLPANFARHEFVDQVFVIRPESLHIWLGLILRVEIVWIELPDPIEHFAVLVVHQVIVFSFAMARVKAVITNHVES